LRNHLYGAIAVRGVDPLHIRENISACLFRQRTFAAGLCRIACQHFGLRSMSVNASLAKLDIAYHRERRSDGHALS
jgi:hypothetical protein